MFDFYKYYEGILGKLFLLEKDQEKFPKGKPLRFKKELLKLFKENIESKNTDGLRATIGIAFMDGVDKDYTAFLIYLLGEQWHIQEEDIIELLEMTKDPKSINVLFDTAINVPDYDEMRAVAKKCISALAAINTKEARGKLVELSQLDDEIIKGEALMYLRHISNSDLL